MHVAEAGYIDMETGFAGKPTRTVCRITQKGIYAFLQYVETSQSYPNSPKEE
ncbi:MAG: transcriptional regulator [Proteiniphilum sp.]